MRSLTSILACLLAALALAGPAGAQSQDLRSPDARDAAQPRQAPLDLHRRQDVSDRPEIRVVQSPSPDSGTPWALIGVAFAGGAAAALASRRLVRVRFA